jgi:hypothetical protein
MKASYSWFPSRSPGPLYSGSSTSITTISRPRSASAFFTVGEYSRSVISTLASPWLSMKPMDSASSRVFRVFSTAPVIGTPKWHSNISGVLLSIAATVSPAPTPRLVSAEARRRARSYSWRQV